MKNIPLVLTAIMLLISISSCKTTTQNNSSFEEMKKLINTTNRSRLFVIQQDSSLNYRDFDMKTVNFLEREIDLDGNPKNKEYLVYILGRNNCGSGGCNLFVISNENKVISTTTVVNFPIYIEESEVDLGEWKNLIVWSNGSFRKLVSENGTYSYNSSMAEKVSKNEISDNPKRYLRILDYLTKEEHER